MKKFLVILIILIGIIALFYIINPFEIFQIEYSESKQVTDTAQYTVFNTVWVLNQQPEYTFGDDGFVHLNFVVNNLNPFSDARKLKLPQTFFDNYQLGVYFPADVSMKLAYNNIDSSYSWNTYQPFTYKVNALCKLDKGAFWNVATGGYNANGNPLRTPYNEADITCQILSDIPKPTTDAKHMTFTDLSINSNIYKKGFMPPVQVQTNTPQTTTQTQPNQNTNTQQTSPQTPSSVTTEKGWLIKFIDWLKAFFTK